MPRTEPITIAVLLALAVTAAGEGPALRAVDAYWESPRHLAVLASCDGATPLHLGSRITLHSPGGEVGAVWAVAEQLDLFGAGRIWIRVLTENPDPPREGLALEVPTAYGANRVPVPAAPGGPLIRYAVVQPDGAGYLYVTNPGNRECTLYGLQLERARVAVTGSPWPITLAPGATRCLPAAFRGVDPGSTQVWHDTARFSSSAGVVHRRLVLFPAERFGFGGEDQHWTMACPTHGKGTFDAAAARLFALHRAAGDEPRSVHICRQEFLHGVQLFGPCIEEARVNLQAANLAQGHTDWVRGLLAVGGFCRANTEPGVFSAVIDSESSAPDSPRWAPASGTELETTALLALFTGARGLRFRYSTGGPWGHQHFQVIAGLQRRLATLAERFALGYPLSGAVHVATPGVIARAVQVGTQGLLVGLFSEARAPHAAVALSLDLPPGFDVQSAHECWRTGTGVPIHVTDRTAVIRLEKLTLPAVLWLPNDSETRHDP
jgi:hypothetical protein